MQKYESRNDVPTKYKWDLTDLFKNEKDFENNYKKVKEDIPKLKKYKGCTKNAKKLYDYLVFSRDIIVLAERLYIYSYLINDEELGNASSLSRKSKTEDLLNLYFLNVSFFEPELLKLSKQEYNNLFKSNNKLDEFKKELDDIYRCKEHILSEREENIITELTNAMNHFEVMSSTMLNSEHNYGEIEIDGEKEIITSTNLRRLLKNKDRNIRKEVRDKFYKTINEYLTSSAMYLNGFVKANLTVAKLHNYKDAWDAKLFSTRVPNEAYETLVKTVEKNVYVLHKYYRTFREYLKLDKLYQYDLSLEMCPIDKEYSIEEAQELCLKAIEPLGEDYYKHFKKIFDNRYIDYAQYKGKCSGGYSFAPYDRDSKILMSYNYDLSSVSTIIHEGGHNVHHQYLSENNPLQYREVPSIVAEVASLTNECLLSNYLANNGSTKEEKLAGINNILNVIISNLFGAVREGKMEQDFYNYVKDGNIINKDYMNELTKKYFDLYHGKEVEDEEEKYYTWAQRSHYYMGYYLYSYSFCISAASYVASKISSGDKEMLNKYLKFLKTGGDHTPVEAFKVLGIDLKDKKVYENAIKYFDTMLDKFIEISKEG